jgi:formylglycine-generating enzyme required for sulfatase activity
VANKYALLIANSEYRHATIRALVKTTTDAEGMQEVLADANICAFPTENITLLKERPSHEVRLEIEKFFKHKQPDDLLVLYFAGHGMRDGEGHLCLTFVDTNPEYSESTGIEARVISRHMDRSRSMRQVVLLDCCYSGAFAHGARNMVGSSMDTKEAFRGEQDGRGRVVITSSDKQQVSLEQLDEVEDTGYAVFTGCVIKGLRSGEAADERGDVKVRSLYEYLYEQVTDLTGGKQTPKLIDYGSAGNLILAKNPHPPLPKELRDRLASDSHIVRISAVYDLKARIDSDSEYAKAAREALWETYRHDRDIGVHDAARHCLQDIGELHKEPEKPGNEQQPVSRTPVKRKAAYLALAMGLLVALFGGGIVYFSHNRQDQLAFPLIFDESENINRIQAEEKVKQALAAIDKRNLDRAEDLLSEVAKLDAEAKGLSDAQKRLDEARKRLAAARSEAAASTTSRKAGEIFQDTVTGMAFAWVPEGCFQMGSSEGDSDEKPVHEVCVDGFWMGKYEVTQGQWKKIMGNNPAYFKKGDNPPVGTVSWNDVQNFINKLNSKGQGGFRLPTEAEWEYACRSGGKQAKYCGGDDVDRVAWYEKNSGNKTHPVGEKAANGLGLYDMSGNVWEWVGDWYDKNYYGNSPKNNPQGPSSGSYRVIRGGSWDDDAGICRSASRRYWPPGDRSINLGFRLARTNP